MNSDKLKTKLVGLYSRELDGITKAVDVQEALNEHNELRKPMTDVEKFEDDWETRKQKHYLEAIVEKLEEQVEALKNQIK